MGRFAPRPKVGPIGQRAPLAHPQSIRYEEQPMHHKRCKFQVKIQQTFEWPQLVGSEEECSLRINNLFFGWFYHLQSTGLRWQRPQSADVAKGERKKRILQTVLV